MRQDNPFELIQKYVASGIFPGASFAIVTGQRSEKYVIGNASLKPERLPLKQDMSYDLASVSKVVGTGTVMIDLILSGQIALDGKLSDYYSDFKGQGGEALTIRQLMTHTSGIDPYIENRNQMTSIELRQALNRVKVTQDHRFHYSDVNFILLGFLLEAFFQQDLSEILKTYVFTPMGMTHTGYKAIGEAVPTAWNLPAGIVHDPKARVLGIHTGSAGLFSNLDDLISFCSGYFANPTYLALLQDYGQSNQARSLAWDFVALPENEDNSGFSGQWLLHTGYTGTFLMLDLLSQQAVIFLSNRVHLKDERQQWIKDRDKLIQAFLRFLKDTENP